MQIIKPSAEIVDDINGQAVLRKLEEAGRTCYRSEDKIGAGTAETFIASIIKRGHESVLEHFSFTARIVCDRGVSHELVRHRLASYSQESQRYCSYSKDKFGNEITVIAPCFLDEKSRAWQIWKSSCKQSENTYFWMLSEGFAPQHARAVLPNSCKTEVVMTSNVREWRHFFRQRTSAAAHPQMVEVATMLLDEAQLKMPVLFDDIQVGGVA